MIIRVLAQKPINLKLPFIMRTLTLLIVMFIGFLSTTLTAQNTIYLDDNWQKTSKENHEYYRPAPKAINNGFWIVDYYKDGQVQMEGYSKNKELNNEVFEGLIMYYHPNGKLFHKANYINGKLDGDRKVFYETGELKEQGEYTNGQRDGIWKTFYKNGKIETKGKYRDNEKVGVWKTFYKNVY